MLFALICGGVAVVAGGLGVLLIVRRRRAATTAISIMDTPPFGFPLPPVGPSDQPQNNQPQNNQPQNSGPYDADQTERRDVTLREEQTERQTRALETDISPWSPLASEPRTVKADKADNDGDVDSAEDSTERHSL
jgi:hypothetical protein